MDPPGPCESLRSLRIPQVPANPPGPCKSKAQHELHVQLFQAGCTQAELSCPQSPPTLLLGVSTPVLVQTRASGHPVCLPFARVVGLAVGGRMLTLQVNTLWDATSTDYIPGFSLMIHAGSIWRSHYILPLVENVHFLIPVWKEHTQLVNLEAHDSFWRLQRKHNRKLGTISLGKRANH